MACVQLWESDKEIVFHEICTEPKVAFLFLWINLTPELDLWFYPVLLHTVPLQMRLESRQESKQKVANYKNRKDKKPLGVIKETQEEPKGKVKQNNKR